MTAPPPAKRARTGPTPSDTLCDCCVRTETALDELIEDAEADDGEGADMLDSSDWIDILRKLRGTATNCCLKRKRTPLKPAAAVSASPRSTPKHNKE